MGAKVKGVIYFIRSGGWRTVFCGGKKGSRQPAMAVWREQWEGKTLERRFRRL